MAFKRPDGVTGPDTLATTSVAVGVWTPQDQQQNQGAGTWPIVAASTPTSVQNITVSNGGTGYDSDVPPIVTVAAPPSGTTATAVATVVDGAVVGIDVTSGGSGYITPPVITIAPPTSGTTATATAQLKNPSPAAIVATGGNTVVDIGGYRIHTFTSSGTFNVTAAPSGSAIDALLVGGGGGGSQGTINQGGGGGGAGGVIYLTGQAITVQAYSIVVGAGGTGALTPTLSNVAANGQDSTGFGQTAVGGGAAGRVLSTPGPTAGAIGGSGGGGSSTNANSTNAGSSGGIGTVGPPVQGSTAGSSVNPGNSNGFGSGGGGGAGGIGYNGTNWNPRGFYRQISGNGGLPRQFSISGSTASYAGGGGGGCLNNTTDPVSFQAIAGNGGYGNNTKTFLGTASASTSTMTVSAVSGGAIYVGMTIYLTDNTTRTVTAFGSGSGGIGTYTISPATTFGSMSVSGIYSPAPSIGTGGAGNGGKGAVGGTATANTGSGGGGGGYNNTSSTNNSGGSGGSGVVIIRYPI